MDIGIICYNSENLPTLPWQTLHVKGEEYNKQTKYLKSFFYFTDYVNFMVKLIIPCFETFESFPALLILRLAP